MIEPKTREINFSYNWNKKLDCNAFTTIRLLQPHKYIPGQQYEIRLKDKKIADAEIVSVKAFFLHQLNEFISYLDTRYSIEECKAIILKMYLKVNFINQQLSLILIKKINHEQTKSKL